MKYKQRDIPKRIEYAKREFEKNNLEYILKNEKLGIFEVFVSGKKFVFQADKGKVYPFDKDIRGVHNCIQYMLIEGLADD